jgi:hypothetical protein
MKIREFLDLKVILAHFFLLFSCFVFGQGGGAFYLSSKWKCRSYNITTVESGKNPARRHSGLHHDC